MRSKFLILLSLIATFVTNAHPGHDHNNISNPLLHSTLTVAIIAVGALAVYLYTRSKQNNK